MQLRTILHPTDFTHSSETALQQAAAVARDYGTRLLILHAAELLHPPRGVFSRSCLPAHYARARQQLWDQLNHVQVPFPDIPVEYLLSEDDPVSAIVRTAAARDSDLIVMGGHGPSGLRGLLTAGVAEQVVRWAHCPVLVIKPSAEMEQALGAKYRTLPAGQSDNLAGPFFALPEVRARLGW
jgi:nucleotide-binding universal stress UspA family protein